MKFEFQSRFSGRNTYPNAQLLPSLKGSKLVNFRMSKPNIYINDQIDSMLVLPMFRMMIQKMPRKKKLIAMGLS